ncbi:MAG: type II toxin-antitoxin system YafQ family toxin [Pseudomonadales bacterium]|jgi:mRNA interferase YafQ|nr:type II toxin-antitoxin system YafQ family toxin [Pseudomonadales bacterium]
MRDLYLSNQFRKDLYREYSTRADVTKNRTLREELAFVLGRSLFDLPLEQRHKDHGLVGSWIGFRDCHVFNDLVLIYRKYDKKTSHKQYGDNALVLARLGSHSALDL